MACLVMNLALVTLINHGEVLEALWVDVYLLVDGVNVYSYKIGERGKGGDHLEGKCEIKVCTYLKHYINLVLILWDLEGPVGK